MRVSKKIVSDYNRNGILCLGKIIFLTKKSMQMTYFQKSFYFLFCFASFLISLMNFDFVDLFMNYSSKMILNVFIFFFFLSRMGFILAKILLKSRSMNTDFAHLLTKYDTMYDLYKL